MRSWWDLFWAGAAAKMRFWGATPSGEEPMAMGSGWDQFWRGAHGSGGSLPPQDAHAWGGDDGAGAPRRGRGEEQAATFVFLPLPPRPGGDAFLPPPLPRLGVVVVGGGPVASGTPHLGEERWRGPTEALGLRGAGSRRSGVLRLRPGGPRGMAGAGARMLGWGGTSTLGSPGGPTGTPGD